MIVLGVAVTADLYTRWRDWLAPEVQPFFVASLRPWPKSAIRTTSLAPELGHTYRTWRIARSVKTLWLDEATFHDMTRSKRAALVRAQVEIGRGAVPSVRRWSDLLDSAWLRSQADGHRFVWWPSLVATNPSDIVSRVVAASPDGAQAYALPSRHREVERATWKKCAPVLPHARRLAGSFPMSSGPNCFGAVMAAAGVEGAERDCMVQAPFLAWLDSYCRTGGRDGDPGTLLVWRDDEKVPVHAAVTLGGDWILEKASGEWWTPYAIRTVADVLRTSRARGQRLERHRLDSTASAR